MVYLLCLRCNARMVQGVEAGVIEVRIVASPYCSGPLRSLPKVVKAEEGTTIGELLGQLLGGHGGTEQDRDLLALLEGYVILVNGRNIFYLSRFDTILSDQDEVAILPRLVGG